MAPKRKHQSTSLMGKKKVKESKMKEIQVKGQIHHCQDMCTYRIAGTSFITQWMAQCMTCFTEKEQEDKTNLVCLACASHCHSGHQLSEIKEWPQAYCDCGHKGKCRPITGPGLSIFIPKGATLISPSFTSSLKLPSQSMESHSSSSSSSSSTAKPNHVSKESDNESDNNSDNDSDNEKGSDKEKVNNKEKQLIPSNEFSRKLFDTYQLHKKKTTGPIFLGAANLFETLLVLYPGATGAAASEMSRLFEMHTSRAIGYMRCLHDTYMKTPEMKSFHWLVVPNQLNLKDEYLLDLAKMAVPVDQTLDLTKPKEETKRLNDRVAIFTNGLVTNLIDEKAITPLTRLIVVGTNYFKGVWNKEFPPSKPGTFTGRYQGEEREELLLTAEKTKQMYYQTADFQCIQKQYKGDHFAMGLVLPISIEIDVRKEFFPEIDFTKFKTETIAEFVMPQFKGQTIYNDAIPHLKKMGLKAMFQPGPHFQNVADNISDIYVSHIFHQCTIEVDAQGTTASAATAVFGTRKCISRPKQEICFLANRPFYWYIVDLHDSSLPLVRWIGTYA